MWQADSMKLLSVPHQRGPWVDLAAVVYTAILFHFVGNGTARRHRAPQGMSTVTTRESMGTVCS